MTEKPKRKSPTPGLAIRNAITRLSLTDLMRLATELRVYSEPWTAQNDNLADSLVRFEEQSRAALAACFKVPPKIVKSEKLAVRSPSVRKFLETGERPVDPVVQSQGGVFLREGEQGPF